MITKFIHFHFHCGHNMQLFAFQASNCMHKGRDPVGVDQKQCQACTQVTQ